MFDFDRVQNALENLGASVDASESHGTLCALLLDKAAFSTWLSHTLEELPERGDALAAEHLQVLDRLYAETREQLDQDELGLTLLLPDESDDFGLRLIGLAGWCQGFLYGIGVTGLGEDERLDTEARECLSDLLEISKLSHDEDSSEEAELQYAEIVEHVRMATLLLNETLNPLESPSVVH